MSCELKMFTMILFAAILPENLTDEAFIKRSDPNSVFAVIKFKDPLQWK